MINFYHPADSVGTPRKLVPAHRGGSAAAGMLVVEKTGYPVQEQAFGVAEIFYLLGAGERLQGVAAVSGEQGGEIGVVQSAPVKNRP